MKTYRVWLKDGVSVEVRAHGFCFVSTGVHFLHKWEGHSKVIAVVFSETDRGFRLRDDGDFEEWA